MIVKKEMLSVIVDKNGNIIKMECITPRGKQHYSASSLEQVLNDVFQPCSLTLIDDEFIYLFSRNAE